MWEYNKYLQHYSSPYYDPAKAHEYYEQHKKLKGKTTATSLNTEGRKIASYVKKQINDERDAKLQEETDSYKKQEEQKLKQKQNTVKQHHEALTQRIESLQNLIKRMPENQKHSQLPKIKAAIYKLREANDKKRKEIEEKYAKDQHDSSVNSQLNKQKIREEAESKYNEEYEKISKEKTYQNSKITKNKTNKSKTNIKKKF